MIVSGEQWRGTQPYIYMDPFSLKFPSRLPHNIEESSMYYTSSPCWLFILIFFNIKNILYWGRGD